VSDLTEKRRELERAQQGRPPTSVCEEHGEYEGEVCLGCYAVQQERVERESLLLREANTSEALRARVLADLAGRNGG
jgi:hypothetical protein